MNIKELLDRGFSVDEISEMFKSELNAEVAFRKEEKEKAAQAEEEKAKRDEALSTARAHLISAIDMYNKVFDFGDFNNDTAIALEKMLIEFENYILENREAVDIYLKMYDAASKNPRDSHLGGPFTSYLLRKRFKM